MVELNDCDPRSIHVREDGSLEIGDTTTFSRYLRGGAITEVKRPKTVRHKSLDTALLQPHVVAQSSQEVHRAHCLHQAFCALHKFQHLHGRPPQPWDPVSGPVAPTPGLCHLLGSHLPEATMTIHKSKFDLLTLQPLE
ncbi:hypothetical protein H8959_018540 [Pygathrix nigripes]